ncbi:Mini-ribonuclease 3 [Streptococcus halichoeri]|uniref:Mini-ribonuclease 3 n=1 Tax=Streptococcus halichoeri TaxID=254785 RepID=UPI0013591B3B|nr:Mini-ribonuclease 3 [Streptococcus halichoeri]
MTSVDVRLINGIALAFEGDAVYSYYIRRHLIFQGQTKPSQLHHRSTRYVSARAQAQLIQAMLDQGLLSEDEIAYYKRGRNTKSHTKAKNADVITYRMSTGFEAVMGYLDMTDQKQRLEELIAWCINYVEQKNKE